MSKEAFYFSHDYNARADRKLVSLVMKHGMVGIGVYWCLVEMLYEECGYIPLEYDRITYELRTEKNVIESIINDSELFQNDGEKFWSNAVLERLEKRAEKSEKARESINKRWDKVKNNTNVIRTYNKRNTIKERKGKESKGEESKIIISTWKNDFSIYKTELLKSFELIKSDSEFISMQEKYNPNVDIILSIEKSINNYWITEAGWKKKKASKIIDIDWKQTLVNALKFDKVYINNLNANKNGLKINFE